MIRRTWLIAQLVLVGASAVLSFPSAGLAFRGVGISLTAAGPLPAVQTFPAGMYPIWFNNDAVTHTVAFANGLCTFQLGPGGYGQCPYAFIGYVGTYAYTVDGTAEASLVVTPDSRSVSLYACSHTIVRGSQLPLQGILDDYDLSPPGAGPEQPIVVWARHDRHHPFRRVAVVTAKLQRPSKGSPFGKLVWQLRVRPNRRTIYIAEAASQPKGGQVWEHAWSRPFRVSVGR